MDSSNSDPPTEGSPTQEDGDETSPPKSPESSTAQVRRNMTALERQAVTEYKARRYTGGIHPQRLYHLTHGHIQSVLAKGSRIAAIRETYGQIQRERIRAMHGRLATTHRRLGGLLKEADEDPSGDAMNGYNRVLPYLTVAGSMRKDELDTLLQDTYIERSPFEDVVGESLCRTCRNLNLSKELFEPLPWRYPTSLMNDLDPGNDYSDAELSKKIPSDVYGFQNGQLTDHETFPNPTITQKLGALLDIRKNDKCSFCMLVADTFLPLFLEEIEEGYPLWELYQPEKEIWLSLYYDIRGDSFDLDNFELHGLHTHKYPSLRYPRGKIRAILSIKDNAWTKRHELLSDARAEIVPMRDVLELEDAGSGARSWNPIGIDTELPEEWLKICERDHGARCAAPKMFDGLPIYEELLLLDVRRGCLVKGFQGRRYFALSYVWGKTLSDTFVTTRETLNDLLQDGGIEIYWDRIAKTIKDAICLVKDMKERYFWCDALCIVQDDTETKDLAIDNMDAVFRQAILTIIAADAEDADEGIAGGCSRPRERIQRVYRYDDNLRLNVTEMCDTGNPIIATISSPWSRRAWTFQERHFSKRILLFLNSSVYWSCGCLRWAEDRCSLSERNAPPWDYYDQPIFETDSFALYLNSPGIIGQEALLFAWQNLLETYSGLDLTFQSDILRALAGLQTYFSHFFKTEFLFGNPIEGFANYLWWFPSGPTRAMRRLTDGVIPTWSWAGSVCETQFYRFEIPDRKESTRERFVLTMPPNGQDEGEDPDILSAKALKLHTMSRMLRLEERTQRSPFAGLPYQYCFNYDLVTSEGVVLGIVSSMSERIYNRYYEPAATTTATEEPANSSDANVETDDNASNAEIEKEDTELESESSSPESKADTASEVKNDADAPLGGWGPREFIVVSNELMDGGGKGLVLRHPFYWVLMVERKGDIVHRVGIGRVEADIWHKGEEEGEDGFAWKDVLLI